jgi:GH15 family glucan-1,4-alpha-glucosidase
MTYAPRRWSGRRPHRRPFRTDRRRTELGLARQLDQGRSFSFPALLGLGFTDQAAAFASGPGTGSDTRVRGRGPLNIMHCIDASPDLSEETLEHSQGYRSSSPVRIGNGAAGQLQLNFYGALDTSYHGDRHALQVGQQGWLAICDLLDWLTDNWDQPEEGIWETRDGRKDFTYGRLMIWVALDRGVRLATAHRRPAPWTDGLDIRRSHESSTPSSYWRTKACRAGLHPRAMICS